MNTADPTRTVAARTALCRCRFIGVAVGLILLTAASFKAYAVAVQPATSLSVWSSTPVMALVIQFELLLGVWLISGVYSRYSRGAALGAFALLAVIALLKALNGESSCACFGLVEIGPWLALCLDLVVLGALWRWQPIDSYNRPSLLRWLATAGTLGLLVAVPVLMSRTGTNRAIVSAEPALVDFGVVAQGESATAEITLINRTGQRFVIGRAQSSCECLTISINAQEIAPGQRAPGKLLLDMGREPGFAGGLLMTLNVFDTGEQNAVVVQVRVRVRTI